MKTFYIGLGKDNEIIAATIASKNSAQDIKEFANEGLKVLKVEAESITIGNYWGYENQSKLADQIRAEGRKEVIDYINKSLEKFGYVSLNNAVNSGAWKNKLKEWGIE